MVVDRDLVDLLRIERLAAHALDVVVLVDDHAQVEVQKVGCGLGRGACGRGRLLNDLAGERDDRKGALEGELAEEVCGIKRRCVGDTAGDVGGDGEGGTARERILVRKEPDDNQSAIHGNRRTYLPCGRGRAGSPSWPE